MVSVCLSCHTSLEIEHGDVLIRWDQHKKISDYTRYASGKLLKCVNCGFSIIQISSIDEEDMTYHKDLGHYRAKWKIIDDRWAYP